MEYASLLLLAVALSLDGLGAGVAYGMKGVRLPFGPLLIIGAIAAAAVWMSGHIASTVTAFMPPHMASAIGSGLLILLGIWGLGQEWLKQWIPSCEQHTHVQFKLDIGVLSMVINIYKKPLAADIDFSGTLDCREALLLGLALSLDSVVAGFGITMSGGLTLAAPLVIGAIQMLFVKVGTVWGQNLRVVTDQEHKLYYLPGAILVVLGLARLFKP